jgi:hypothetical protein
VPAHRDRGRSLTGRSSGTHYGRVLATRRGSRGPGEPRGPSAAALLGGCRQWARDLVSQRTSGSALPAPAHPGSLTLRWAIMRQHWSCRLYPTTHRCPTRPATNRPPGTARSAEKPGPSPPRAGLGQVWPSEIRRPLRPKISQSVAIRDQATTSAPEDFSNDQNAATAIQDPAQENRTSSGPGAGKRVRRPGHPRRFPGVEVGAGSS